MYILRDEHDLLGTESSGSSRFAQLIEDIPTLEGQLGIFKGLVEVFPHQAHFWGHLGRFYSFAMGEPGEAIKAINMAIELSPTDPVLFHMKGMCYRKVAYGLMADLAQQPIGDIQSKLRDTTDNAKNAFGEARSLDSDSEHAYISPAQLLLRVLDFGFKVSGHSSRTDFLVSPSSTWYRDQLDEVEHLLERVSTIREGDKPSKYVLACEADLNQVYDNYSRALEGWSNLLTRKDVFAPPIRRQIVRAYLTRRKRDWALLGDKEIERIVDLMDDNMREEPSSDRNIRLWFRAIRFSSRQNIDMALDRIANWKTLGDSVESYFYLYVLHVLKAIDGSMIERERSDDLTKASRTRSRSQRNRTRSFEWLGEGKGLERLKHYSELGEWDEKTNFYSDASRLVRVEGTHFSNQWSRSRFD